MGTEAVLPHIHSAPSAGIAGFPSDFSPDRVPDRGKKSFLVQLLAICVYAIATRRHPPGRFAKGNSDICRKTGSRVAHRPAVGIICSAPSIKRSRTPVIEGASPGARLRGFAYRPQSFSADKVDIMIGHPYAREVCHDSTGKSR